MAHTAGLVFTSNLNSQTTWLKLKLVNLDLAPSNYQGIPAMIA